MIGEIIISFISMAIFLSFWLVGLSVVLPHLTIW